MAGKSLDQLNLSDTPLPKPTDVRDEPWFQFYQEIEDLLATGRVTFAESTLLSIQETVEKYHTVSDGQRRAVRNIEDAANRPRYGGYRGRRYEGFR